MKDSEVLSVRLGAADAKMLREFAERENLGLANAVRVLIRHASQLTPRYDGTLQTTDKRIVQLLTWAYSNKPFTRREMAERLGIKVNALHYALCRLEKLGWKFERTTGSRYMATRPKETASE